MERNKEVAIESPASRASGTIFSNDGQEDHADMFSYSRVACLKKDRQLRRLFFDQCLLGSSTQKSTQILTTAAWYSKLRLRLAKCVCTHGEDAHPPLCGLPDKDGTFSSSESSAYPSELNRHLVESLIEASTVEALSTPVEEWADWLGRSTLMSRTSERDHRPNTSASIATCSRWG